MTARSSGPRRRRFDSTYEGLKLLRYRRHGDPEWRFDSTYEGLKQRRPRPAQLPDPRFDSTYEGLKHSVMALALALHAFRQYL